MHKATELLFNHHANPHLVCRQVLWRRVPSYFPGDVNFEQEAVDSDGEWLGIDKTKRPCRYPPRARPHGFRCIAHSMLEDGGYFKPFLELD